MNAYYNEHDADKAAWLRELIKAGLITPGEVDERDIQDVLPRELVGYTQCHFFAGIGIWSYSLRCAGWPDDRSVWTGSCPCQPFSDAGQRKGTADERHLWPAFFHLIRVCKPDVVFGEQVAKKNGLAWLDIVQADLESEAYAVGAVAIPACGFGAPHKRERLYFVADANGSGRARPGSSQSEEWRSNLVAARRSSPSGMADSNSNGAERAGREEQFVVSGCASRVVGVAHDARREGRGLLGTDQDGRGGSERAAGTPSPVNGFWRDAEWVYCRDDLYRSTRPGAFPLAHGSAARILRLRGYGDGIVAPGAEEFIRAYLEVKANS